MKARRRNYDGDGKDRISDLPDCILLEILSHLKMKQAVEISILSTRWNNLWKHMTVLFLHYRNFESVESFANFVSQFFSFRNDKTSLQALAFECLHYFDPEQLKRILKYLFSHNVERLDMTVACSLEHFPLCSSFSCRTLTSLELNPCQETKQIPRSLPPPVFPNSLKFPALTNLSLRYFTFRCTTDDTYAEPFSGFQSLNTLIIQNCMLFKDNLFISSASLVNLTILLCIVGRSYTLKLSTPNLCSFDFSGRPFPYLCGHNNIGNTNFSCIKHVKIDLLLLNTVPNISSILRVYPNISSILFNWFAELALVESLTISSRTLEILNLIPDSWKIDFPFLHKLKLLKIETPERVPPVGTEDFLLQNSPSAKKVISPGPSLKDFFREERTRRKQFRY